MNTELQTTPENPMALLMGMDLKTADPDKLGKLLDLQAKWEDRQAEKAIADAMASFQKDAPAIKKERKTNNSQYASLDDIMFAIREPLSRNGLSVSFDTEATETNLTAVCHILHSGGAKFTRSMTVPIDKGMRGANVTQQLGSASSYAKRYAIVNALNLVITDQDDDGNGAGSASLSEEQAAEIYNMLEQCPPNTKEGFLRFFESETVEEIPDRDFNKAVALLKGKIKVTQK